MAFLVHPPLLLTRAPLPLDMRDFTIDFLLFYHLLAYMVSLLISHCSTIVEAWSNLETMYTNKSTSWMIGPLDSFTKISKEGKTVAEYIQFLKSIVDDLAMIGHELSDGEMTIHALNGLTSNFKELAAAI